MSGKGVCVRKKSGGSHTPLNFKNHCMFCLKEQSASAILDIVKRNPRNIQNFQPLIHYITGTLSGGSSPKDKKVPVMGNLPPMCTSCYDHLATLYGLHEALLGIQRLIQRQTTHLRNIVKRTMTTSVSKAQKGMTRRKRFYTTLKTAAVPEAQFDKMKAFIENFYDLVPSPETKVMFPVHAQPPPMPPPLPPPSKLSVVPPDEKSLVGVMEPPPPPPPTTTVQQPLPGPKVISRSEEQQANNIEQPPSKDQQEPELPPPPAPPSKYNTRTLRRRVVIIPAVEEVVNLGEIDLDNAETIESNEDEESLALEHRDVAEADPFSDPGINNNDKVETEHDTQPKSNGLGDEQENEKSKSKQEIASQLTMEET